MDSPLISSHTNKSKATPDPLKPCSKLLYVILPGHPFYGQKVKVLQSGSTDTMNWCLFEHPKYKYFHYRISQRWLSEEPPPEIIPSDRTNTQFVLSFSALQKFAKILLPPVSPSSLTVELDNPTGSQAESSKQEYEHTKEGQHAQGNHYSSFSIEQEGELL